jgi:hypothetical protein
MQVLPTAHQSALHAVIIRWISRLLVAIGRYDGRVERLWEILVWAKCLLLDGQLVDDSVRWNNI